MDFKWGDMGTMKQPKTYSFDDVNDFVHSTNTEFEELQCACLGMATEISKLSVDKKRLDWLADKDNDLGIVQLPKECVLKNIHSLRDAIDDAMKMNGEEK